jgi:hypothetical protein
MMLFRTNKMYKNTIVVHFEASVNSLFLGSHWKYKFPRVKGMENIKWEGQSNIPPRPAQNSRRRCTNFGGQQISVIEDLPEYALFLFEHLSFSEETTSKHHPPHHYNTLLNTHFLSKDFFYITLMRQYYDITNNENTQIIAILRNRYKYMRNE